MSQEVQNQRRETTAFLWGLAVPLGVLVLALKIWRIVERGELQSWWAAPDLVRSDVLAVAGFALVGWMGFRLLDSRKRRLIFLGFCQAAAVVWAGLEVIAHHFFVVTGSTFDLHLLAFTVDRFEEVFDVAASEITFGSVVLLGIALVALLALPWGLWKWRNTASEDGDSDGGAASSGLHPGVFAAVAVVCIAGTFFPPLADDHVAFGRATVVNLVLSIQDVRAADQLEETIDRRPLDNLRVDRTERVDEGPRNLAVIILESTRAESMTVYDESMETTPFLAELAEKSTVAERAYSVVPHTSKALVAMLCGIEPRLRMPITEYRPDGLPARCLAELLGDHDYSSVFLQSATERFEDRPRLVDQMGYDEFIPLERMDRRDYEDANYFGPEDAIMLPYSRDWLSDHGDEPFFATYLTLTPHHDYRAPAERYGRFEFVADDDELNRYKNTLYYVDQFTRELLEQYQKLGLYEDTLFVIVGDHGEAFGEHGRTQHDNVIWEQGLRVPWLIYDPTDPKHEWIEYPISHIDMAPTILEWMGWEVTGGEYPGKEMWDTHQDRVVYSHCWYERRCMARTGHRWKYIDHFGRRTPEVYDLLEDPREQNNLIDEKSDQARLWRAEVFGWRESVNNMYRREHVGYIDDHIHDELPDGVVERSFELGEFARYRGYRLDADELRRGQRVSVTHYFEVLDSIPAGWRLFVHGVSARDQMLNLDHVPVDGMHPLDEWEPGTIVASEQDFRIPSDWPPETFVLYVGIYHPDEGRVPIFGDVPTDGDRRAVVFEKDLR